MKILSKYWVSIFLILVTLPSVYHLLIPGFYEPHDLHHFADIYEMYKAFASGQMPPRLGPDFLFGYGYPLFNFYYLIPFYFGAFFFKLFGSLQASFEFVFILSCFLSVFGMYVFLREFFGKWSSLAGSVLFLYTPYRAVQIYVRGAMGEAFALSLLPFVAWSYVRLSKNPKEKKLLIISILLTAIFILTHNYLWVIALPFLVFLTLLISDKKKKRDILISFIILGAFSLGLSAYWWLPALIEQSLVSSLTPFPLIDHFPFVKQLVFPSWGYGSSEWGPNDEISFQVGIINWIIFLFLAGLVMFKKLENSKLTSKLSLWAFLGFFFSLFLMNIRSYPLWRILPFHDFIQFPWRLLFLTTFFTSFMASVVVAAIKRYQKIFSWLVIFGSIILTIGYFRPSRIVFKSDDDYLKRFFAYSVIKGEEAGVSPEYLQYSEDYLLLPKWVKEKPSQLPKNKIESSEVEVIDYKKLSPVKWSAEIDSRNGGRVTFNSMYFPGWFAEVDGSYAEITIGKPYGQMEINVLPGRHKIVFYWAETPLRKVADFISAISLFMVGVLCNKDRKKR